VERTFGRLRCGLEGGCRLHSSGFERAVVQTVVNLSV